LSTAKHHATCQNSGLATVVVGDSSLGVIDENLSLSGFLATRKLEGRLLVFWGRKDGGSGTVRVSASMREEGVARARVGRTRA